MGVTNGTLILILKTIWTMLIRSFFNCGLWALLLGIFSGATVSLVLGSAKSRKNPQVLCKKVIFFEALTFVVIAQSITKIALYSPEIIKCPRSYAHHQPPELNFADHMPYFWGNVLFGTRGFLICSVILWFIHDIVTMFTWLLLKTRVNTF